MNSANNLNEQILGKQILPQASLHMKSSLANTLMQPCETLIQLNCAQTPNHGNRCLLF